MAVLPRPVIMMIWSQPAARASSTPYWMMACPPGEAFPWAALWWRGESACLVQRREKRLCERVFSWLLQHRRIVAQHGFANYLYRHPALPHELVVKFLQAEACALRPLVVVAQLHDLQLAQGVNQVSGIGGAALGFHFGHGMGLETLFDEEVHTLVESHFSGVHFDADDVAGIAQQGVLQLPQAQLQEGGV